MGKRGLVRRRGKGSMTFRAHTHKWLAEVRYKAIKGTRTGTVMDIAHDPGRNAPLAKIKFDGERVWQLASEGIKVGDTIQYGVGAEAKIGNVLPLGKIPEGTTIFNIEATPEDGGRFARSSGVCAIIISHADKKTVVQLPSKRMVELDPRCLATIGVAAGGDRKIKPFVKAGHRHYLMRARGKRYPITSPRSMNAVDHKFGGSHMGVPKTVSRHAPPGRKVGSIAASRTGRKKR